MGEGDRQFRNWYGPRALRYGGRAPQGHSMPQASLIPVSERQGRETLKTYFLSVFFILKCTYLHNVDVPPSGQIPATVTVGDQPPVTYTCPSFPSSPASDDSAAKETHNGGSVHKGEETFTLEDLAFARSGDKGNTMLTFIHRFWGAYGLHW